MRALVESSSQDGNTDDRRAGSTSRMNFCFARGLRAGAVEDGLLGLRAPQKTAIIRSGSGSYGECRLNPYWHWRGCVSSRERFDR
jgi:hypothetical protein